MILLMKIKKFKQNYFNTDNTLQKKSLNIIWNMINFIS